MSVTPTSARAVAAHMVRNMIASCDTFIAAVDASDYEEAKGRIYLVEKFPDYPEDAPTGYARPLALVLMAMFEYKVAKPGYPAGSHEFQLEIDALPLGGDQNVTPEDQATDALNFFGGIEGDLSELGCPIAPAKNDALLRYDRVTQIRPIERSRDTGDVVRDFWRYRGALQLF